MHQPCACESDIERLTEDNCQGDSLKFKPHRSRSLFLTLCTLCYRSPCAYERLLTFITRLGGTRSYHNFRLPPLRLPFWSLNHHACHCQGVGSPTSSRMWLPLQLHPLLHKTHAHWRRSGATTAHCVFYAPPVVILSTTQVDVRVDTCQITLEKKKKKERKIKERKK